MRSSLRPLIIHPAGWMVFCLLALYTIIGLFGHDPWKTEDVVHLAIARDLLTSGYAPGLTLAGDAIFSAPLYYWSAALSGSLFGGLLPLHDALRLTSGLWTALAFAALYYGSRELYGKDHAAASPLLLAGTLGLIARAHEAQPMLVLMAASAILFLAITLLPRKPRISALLTALALILAGLGAGLIGLVLLVLSLTIALLIYRPSGKALLATGIGILAATLVLAASAAWLHYSASSWFLAWISSELTIPTYERYLENLYTLLTLLAWFTWPLIPLACWSIWSGRKQWQAAPILLPLGTFILTLLLVPLIPGNREAVTLALLPSLALLATPGTLALRRGAANAFDWFSGMAFSLCIILLWLGWSATIFEWPPKLAHRAKVLGPGFEGVFNPLFFGLALLITLVWIGLLFKTPRSPYRCLLRWTTGFTAIWLLASALWLPAIDYVKTYRQVARDIARQLPAQPGCIAGYGLGDSQKASFAYFEGLRFSPINRSKGSKCNWLLIQGGSKTGFAPADQGWKKVWEGNRPGDRKERFRLYRKTSD